MKRPVQTAVPLPIDLYTPPEQAAAMAIALADSGVVDYQQPGSVVQLVAQPS